MYKFLIIPLFGFALLLVGCASNGENISDTQNMTSEKEVLPAPPALPE